MRLRQTKVKTYHAANMTLTRDSEGVPSESYGEAYEIKGYIWPATSKVQVEEYGDRIQNIANMRVEGEYQLILDDNVPKIVFGSGNTLQGNDGIYIHADTDGDPDYKVLSITEYEPLRLEIERRV